MTSTSKTEEYGQNNSIVHQDCPQTITRLQTYSGPLIRLVTVYTFQAALEYHRTAAENNNNYQFAWL